MEEKEEEEMERREKQMNRFQCDLWCVMGELRFTRLHSGETGKEDIAPPKPSMMAI